MLTREHFAKQILPITLKNEGGYVFDKNDTGGETYRGISRKNNPNWKGWALLEKHKPLSKGDIINDADLKDAVIDLYYELYFKRLKFDQLNSACLASQLFDYAVHGGYSVKELQNRINLVFNKTLIVDGELGKKSIDTINTIKPDLLAHQILFLRREHLNKIIASKPNQSKFEYGWNKRLDYMRGCIKSWPEEI